MSVTLPDALPGHWDTAGGREMAERYLKETRQQQTKGGLPDFVLANAQYLEDISVGTVTFQSAIAMQTAAKERIRWLSAHLALAELQLTEALRIARLVERGIEDMQCRRTASESIAALIEHLSPASKCQSCGASPVREWLDGDALCQSCCNDWVRGEGAAAAEREALDAAAERGELP
jgi:hypothetical protein